MTICKCGCGEEANPGRKYINYHQNRGRKPNKGHREKMSLARIRYFENPDNREKQSLARIKYFENPEAREIMRKAHLGKRGAEANNWQGGEIHYIHRRAWELFGKEECELCGMTNKQHKINTNMRLYMHSRSDKYELEENNWVTVCSYGCHHKIERIDGGKKNAELSWKR